MMIILSGIRNVMIDIGIVVWLFYFCLYVKIFGLQMKFFNLRNGVREIRIGKIYSSIIIRKVFFFVMWLLQFSGFLMMVLRYSIQMKIGIVVKNLGDESNFMVLSDIEDLFFCSVGYSVIVCYQYCENLI